MQPFRTGITVLLVIVVGITMLHAQHITLAEYYDAQKKQEEATYLSVPGWLINVVSFTAQFFTSDPTTKAAYKLGRKMKRVKLINLEQDLSNVDINMAEMYALLERERFEPLIEIHDGLDAVTLYSRTDKNDRHHLLLMAEDVREITIIDMATRLRGRDFTKLFNLILQEHAPGCNKTG